MGGAEVSAGRWGGRGLGKPQGGAEGGKRLSVGKEAGRSEARARVGERLRGLREGGARAVGEGAWPGGAGLREASGGTALWKESWGEVGGA